MTELSDKAFLLWCFVLRLESILVSLLLKQGRMHTNLFVHFPLIKRRLTGNKQYSSQHIHVSIELDSGLHLLHV